MKTIMLMLAALLLVGCAVADSRRIYWKEVGQSELQELCGASKLLAGCTIKSGSDCMIYTRRQNVDQTLELG